MYLFDAGNHICCSIEWDFPCESQQAAQISTVCFISITVLHIFILFTQVNNAINLLPLLYWIFCRYTKVHWECCALEHLHRNELLQAEHTGDIFRQWTIMSQFLLRLYSSHSYWHMGPWNQGILWWNSA